jgi:hypothetical protein
LLELSEELEDEVQPEVLQISLSAITGISSSETMQIMLCIGSVQLRALLDSGSSHNFISEKAVAMVELPLQGRANLFTTVANGERVQCAGVFKNMAFCIAKDQFQTDLFVFPLGCYDIVLGTHWLASLGPILWDFGKLMMSFWHNDHQVIWYGLQSGACAMIQSEKDNDLLNRLLAEFAFVFQEPQGLPPQRTRDHQIHMLSGSAPVAVRPYRYTKAQKDELVRQCSTMQKQGLIRRSKSPYSSPVLLVRKPDGSWRFYVDYRALNDRTIKNKFPILVVEELLDELHGARFFTKLDLWSGYHQVRMHLADVEKTTFRTHDDLFEFSVMLFGLTNAPATFQALMNDVLRPFLRHFVLVFFDDILIYNNSWAEHLVHLRTVLEVSRENQLFLKKSKCSFATTSITYLGHVVSASGVAMDTRKVQAVLDWPIPLSVRTLRGFLGLAGYYLKFIPNFGSIAAPLTQLLKEGFSWSPDAEAAVRIRQPGYD